MSYFEENYPNFHYPLTTNMRKLIEEIRVTSQSQVFVATHSSLVCTRLDLRNAIMLTSFDKDPIGLRDLPEDTAKFFMKAPSSAVLEFVLSPKSALVEGDAEYILMEAFYKQVTGEELMSSGISIISVGGLSFARYLDIAKLLGNQTAVITDNDGDGENNCVAKYKGYADIENVSIFYDPDDDRSTFEICVYEDNGDICDEIFEGGRKTLSVQDFMLKNKSRAAFELADGKPAQIKVPKYINDAITWLRK